MQRSTCTQLWNQSRFVGEGRRANSDGPITELPLRLRVKRPFFA